MTIYKVAINQVCGVHKLAVSCRSYNSNDSGITSQMQNEGTENVLILTGQMLTQLRQERYNPGYVRRGFLEEVTTVSISAAISLYFNSGFVTTCLGCWDELSQPNADAPPTGLGAQLLPVLDSSVNAREAGWFAC